MNTYRIGIGSVLVVMLLGLGTAPGYAQRSEAARLFEEGNSHYRQGNYAGAIAAYQRVLDQGYASGALYHNLGNAYFRQDDLGQAIRYYLKARQVLPTNREVRHNLEIARARTVDDIAQLPEPFWKPWWQGLVRTLGAGGLFGLGVLFYLTAAALVGRWIWMQERNEWVRRGLAAAGLAAVVFIAAGFLASLTPQLDRQAVIIAEAVVLHDAPVPDATTDLTLHEGLTLSILREQGAWMEVELPNGATGWIEAATVAGV